MKRRARHFWDNLPRQVRRIITLIVGTLLILTSALIGWIPGPGGMIPFLLGIAVLASEFTWAERLRDSILLKIRQIADFVRSNPLYGVILVVATVSVIWLFAYVFYTQIL